jgi:hypothetical protein
MSFPAQSYLTLGNKIYIFGESCLRNKKIEIIWYVNGYKNGEKKRYTNNDIIKINNNGFFEIIIHLPEEIGIDSFNVSFSRDIGNSIADISILSEFNQQRLNFHGYTIIQFGFLSYIMRLSCNN